MSARAIWKGVLRFGETRVPVKLYSGVQDRSVRFRLLHEPDKVPVRQRMVNPVTGRVVPAGEIRKGYEAEEGVFVLLDPEELDSLEPEPSRDIEITRFVPAESVDQQWYDRPYFLGPDGEAEAYFALTAALEKQGRRGVARWVMRKKEYVGALASNGRHLSLITLRHAEEVIPASALPRPPGAKPDAKERAMADQLVSMLEADFEPETYRDQYRDRVLELIQTKAEGGVVEMRPRRRRPPKASLERMLEQSVERVKKERRRAA